MEPRACNALVFLSKLLSESAVLSLDISQDSSQVGGKVEELEMGK